MQCAYTGEVPAHGSSCPETQRLLADIGKSIKHVDVSNSNSNSVLLWVFLSILVL